MSVAVPDPRFRDQLAEALKAHTVVAFAGCDSMCACDRKWRTNIAYREHLAAEVEARVQAAANQRAAEELESWARSFRRVGEFGLRRENRRVFPQVADVLDAGAKDLRAAALASPAPAPHAEEGQ